MNIQLIKKQPFIFRVNNMEYQFVKPKFLLPENSIILIEEKLKGSTMVWNIQGSTVSYNQIKKLCTHQK